MVIAFTYATHYKKIFSTKKTHVNSLNSNSRKYKHRRAKCKLTHCVLVDSSTVICWTSPLSFKRFQIYFVALILSLMEILLANNVAPDQTPHYVASDLGLHCLPVTLLRDSP